MKNEKVSKMKSGPLHEAIVYSASKAIGTLEKWVEEGLEGAALSFSDTGPITGSDSHEQELLSMSLVY